MREPKSKQRKQMELASVILTLFALSAIIYLYSPATTQTESVTKYVASAQEAFASGRLQHASRRVEEALALQPGNADAKRLRDQIRQAQRFNALVERAHADFSSGNYEDSRNATEQALQYESNFASHPVFSVQLERVKVLLQKLTDRLGKGFDRPTPREVIVEPRERINSTADKWHIFLVGTTGYQDSRVSKLRYAADDAVRLGKRFMELGVKEENITILTSKEEDDKYRPSKRIINERYTAFINNLPEDSLALVFLSGHGLQLDGEPYFLPSDYDYDKSKESAVSIKEMFTKLKESHASLRFMLVDACRDDPHAKGVGASTFDPAYLVAHGVTTAALFQSCSENERSYEYPFDTSGKGDDAQGAGIFTEAILQGLSVANNPADADGDGCVTFLEFVDFVCKQTNALADSHKDTQNPSIEGSINNFNFLTLGGSSSE